MTIITSPRESCGAGIACETYVNHPPTAAASGVSAFVTVVPFPLLLAAAVCRCKIGACPACTVHHGLRMNPARTESDSMGKRVP